jgi:hypothetical protein
VSQKKRVKFPKYQIFKHTTESKKKNMVGSNPEILKRKAVEAALNPSYFSSSTESGETGVEYTLVPGNAKGE